MNLLTIGKNNGYPWHLLLDLIDKGEAKGIIEVYAEVKCALGTEMEIAACSRSMHVG